MKSSFVSFFKKLGESKPKDTKEIKPTDFQLPEQRGLRLVIFSLIFKYLNARETLGLGLVCKEWLNISRNDNLWRQHIEQDFLENIREKYPHKDYDYTDNMYIFNFVSNLQIEDDKPAFLEYWRIVDGIVDCKANRIKPEEILYKECGIQTVPRNQNIEILQSVECVKTDISSIINNSNSNINNNQDNIDGECVSNFVSSSSIQSQYSTQFQSQNIQKQEGEEEEVGCCHDAVKLISLKLFSSPRLSCLASLKMDDKQFEMWKKEACKRVSLECMENEMSHTEIRSRLFELICFKFFQF